MSSFLSITEFSVYSQRFLDGDVTQELCWSKVIFPSWEQHSQEELSLAINFRAVFFLCLLLSIIKCLLPAAVVTFGAPVLFWSTFAPVSNCLCKKYCILVLKSSPSGKFVFESRLLWTKSQLVLHLSV